MADTGSTADSVIGLAWRDVMVVGMLKTIDWYEQPAVVVADFGGTSLTNGAGDEMAVNRVGISWKVSGQVTRLNWSEVEVMTVEFPEFPRSLKWVANVLRGALAGAPRGGYKLQFGILSRGSKTGTYAKIDFGSPTAQWNLPSRQFFAALDEVLPAPSDLPNPDLLDAYRRFRQRSIWRRGFRGEVLLREILGTGR